MANPVGYWILVVVGFGFLIFMHELGHFIAAKRMGIRVVRFALGFGPRLLGTNKHADDKDPARRGRGTDYCICLIPCGGYVKMAGGEGGDEEATGASDEFPTKRPGQRAVVVAAGPVMSVLVAIPLLFGVLMGGMERASSRIHWIVPGKPAWNTGLKRGDVITGIRKQGESSWKTIRLWRQVWFNAQLRQKVGDIVVRARRDGVEREYELTTDAKGRSGFGSVRIGTEDGHISNVVGVVPAGGSARKAGIVPGSRLLTLAGRSTHTWADVQNTILEHPGQTVKVTFTAPDGRARAGELAIDAEDCLGLGIRASRSNRVRLVRPGFPAGRAGLRPSDAIVAVNGTPTANWPALESAVLDAAPGPAVLTVERTGDGLVREAKRIGVRLEPGEMVGDVLGVAAEEYPVVEGFLAGSQAEAAGVPAGARLLRVEAPGSRRKPTDLKGVDGVHLLGWAGRSPSARLVFEHEGKEHAAAVPLLKGKVGVVGISPRIDRCRVVEPGQPVAALGQALRETAEWIGFACRSIWMLVSGQISAKLLSGPVLILTASRYFAEAGLFSFIEFMVIITVHLGVINLVPFPILDGGHLFFLLIEKVRGRPLTERVMGRLMYAGMVALIGLMVFVTWNDVSKLLGFG